MTSVNTKERPNMKQLHEEEEEVDERQYLDQIPTLPPFVSQLLAKANVR